MKAASSYPIDPTQIQHFSKVTHPQIISVNQCLSLNGMFSSVSSTIDWQARRAYLRLIVIRFAKANVNENLKSIKPMRRYYNINFRINAFWR
jgi:ubiquitin-protein ligase